MGRELPERKPWSDHQQGLYRKYTVERVHDPTGKHRGCLHYVLDLTHDPFAKPALLAYAEACAAEYPKLAADLRKLVADAD